MSILLRDTRTGIITSTDLFGDTLGLYLRENPDIVRVGLGTTENSDYYVLLNSNDIESTQPNVSNNLKFNPYTGSLSGISSISGTIGYASSAGISTYATTAGISTYASNAGIATYATSAGIATYASSAGIATYATSAGIATNVTTNANLTGHVTSVGNAAVLGSFSSSKLATALTDETGSGSAVFATSPTLVTPVLGTPTSGNLSNCTNLNASNLSSGTIPPERYATNSNAYGIRTVQSGGTPSGGNDGDICYVY